MNSRILLGLSIVGNRCLQVIAGLSFAVTRVQTVADAKSFSELQSLLPAVKIFRVAWRSAIPKSSKLSQLRADSNRPQFRRSRPTHVGGAWLCG